MEQRTCPGPGSVPPPVTANPGSCGGLSCGASCHGCRKAPIQRSHPSAEGEERFGAVLLSTHGCCSGTGPGRCPTMWQGSLRPGDLLRIAAGTGDPRAGWGEQQDRSWGAAPTPEQTAPVHPCCSEGPFRAPGDVSQ